MFDFPETIEGNQRLGAKQSYSKAVLLTRYFNRRAESSIGLGDKFQLGSIIFAFGFLEPDANDPKVMVVGEIKPDTTKNMAQKVWVADNPGITPGSNPHYSFIPANPTIGSGPKIKISVNLPPGKIVGSAALNCAIILDDKSETKGEAVAVMAGQRIDINAGRSIEINAVIEANVI